MNPHRLKVPLLFVTTNFNLEFLSLLEKTSRFRITQMKCCEGVFCEKNYENWLCASHLNHLEFLKKLLHEGHDQNVNVECIICENISRNISYLHENNNNWLDEGDEINDNAILTVGAIESDLKLMREKESAKKIKMQMKICFA